MTEAVQGLDPGTAVGPTEVIDSDHPAVRALATDIVRDADDEVAALFAWVRDRIRYDMGPVLHERSDWTASATVERGFGFCQQKAVLLAALLRARDVPAGIGIEKLLDHKIPPHFAEHMGGQEIPLHGYTVAFLDGAWRRIDATLDSTLCARKGYRVVDYLPGSDRLLPETDLEGNPHFVHLDELGRWPDVPDEIVERTLELSYLKDPTFLEMATRNGPQL